MLYREFTDEFTFTSMHLLSIVYMMLRFVGSLINTQLMIMMTLA